MHMKGIMKFLVAAVILAATVLLTIGASNVQAHNGGHPDGCEEFGEFASGLAGPGFGQFHRESTPGNPGANADMVDNVGHGMCD